MPRVAPPVGGRMRIPFDRDRVFIVVRDLVVSGKKFAGGTKFDVALVTTRRLRQMYECRMLKMSEVASVPEIKLVGKKPIPQPPPDFKALSNRGLRQWLENQGVEVAHRTPHAALVSKALAKWQEIQNGVATANGDSEHSRQRISGRVDDRDAAA